MAFKRIVQIASGPEGTEGTLITENYMEFSITRDLTESPNKAEIKIYNLNDSTISEMAKVKNKVIISAGYEDEGGAKAIFFGDLYSSYVEKAGTERILNIEAFDGLKNIQSKNIVLSYAAGTTPKTIFDDITKVMAYPINGTPPIFSGAYNNGFAFSGKASVALTKILDKIGWRWNIQNEQLCFYQDGVPISAQQLLLTYDTGLIFVQEKDRDNSVDPIKKKDMKPGSYYKLTTLLFPQLIPGAQVKIETDRVNAQMMIETCKINGDNFGGKFEVEADARII